MNNENNIPMTASHMLFHELVANNGAKQDNMNLAEAMEEIKRLRSLNAKMNDQLRELHSEIEHIEGQYGYAMFQRDQIRYDYCILRSKQEFENEEDVLNNAKDLAASYGWDCFTWKETPKKD
jgi:hypothetical protein